MRKLFVFAFVLILAEIAIVDRNRSAVFIA